MQAVTLGRAQQAQILDHCRVCWPEEACGLLIGPSGARGSAVLVKAVEQIWSLPNGLHGTSAALQRFEMLPQDLFDAHRRAREMGRAVIGHFHSHPNGLARPSARDIRAIADPLALWIIAAPHDFGREHHGQEGCPEVWSLSAWLPTREQDGFSPITLATEGSHDGRR